MDGIHLMDSAASSSSEFDQRVVDRSSPESRSTYERYRIGEAMSFLHLVPRDGIRPLYAEAREWARREGIHNSADPMESLLRFLLKVLPLPPYSVWREDVRTCEFEYALRACSAPDAEERAPEVTVDSRTFQHYRKPWNAGLHMYQDGRGWRGFISFAPAAESPLAPAAKVPLAPADGGQSRSAVRTANIFVDSDPRAIRRRFRSYRENVLTGLLRSALP